MKLDTNKRAVSSFVVVVVVIVVGFSWFLVSGSFSSVEVASSFSVMVQCVSGMDSETSS